MFVTAEVQPCSQYSDYNHNCRLHNVLYRTCTSVILLMKVKAHIRTGHEGQREEYMYIYILSLTSYLDAVEWSTPRIGSSTLKDTWCTSTGR